MNKFLQNIALFVIAVLILGAGAVFVTQELFLIPVGYTWKTILAGFTLFFMGSLVVRIGIRAAERKPK